jgi:serine/threonine protein kinase/Tol biopolymer transport system component
MSDPRIQLQAALGDRYVVERELGEGGMARVYLAEDSRHGRKVAVKVLRPDLAAVIGAERFLKEIQLTAALQHPHILPLHDSGAAGDLLFYVMPYVEGETLRARISREKQLGVAEAVEIARQVAAALDYAHRQGVVHRDIKPENIMIHDRQALVADFGIALAMRSAGGSRLTETGMSLGTPQYMSPEQALGDRDLDARSDIYSLGVTVYEMLAGDPPYTGSTAQAIVAKVITARIAPVTTHRETVPPNVAAAVQVALARLPADRFLTAAEFAEALTNPGFTVARAGEPSWLGTNARSPRYFGLLAAAVVGGLILGVVLRPSGSRPAPVTRSSLRFPAEQAPINNPWATLTVAPDGSWIGYVGAQGSDSGQSQLWVKARGRLEAAPLQGTSGAWTPAASPDGRWIAFAISTPGSTQLRKIPVAGGPAVTLADSVRGTDLVTVTWGDDGMITYLDQRSRLRRVSGEGGPSEVAWTPPEGKTTGLITPLPGGRGLLVAVGDAGFRQPDGVWLLDLRSGEAKPLFPRAMGAWYLPTGHVAYSRTDGTIMLVPFDLGSLSPRGTAVPVIEGVQVERIIPQLAVSGEGTVVYFPGGESRDRSEAVWVDRTGRVTPVDSAWRFVPGFNEGWSLSPDGKRLAINFVDEAGEQIWVKELDGGPVSRLTFDGAQHYRPRWLPDGYRVSYLARREGSANSGVYIRRGDGSGTEERMLVIDRSIEETEWSRDGHWLVVRVGGQAGQAGVRDVYAVAIGGDTTLRPLLVGPADENSIRLSPDGRWLAYESNETGRKQVFVRPFPNTGAGRWQVSADGGMAPVWAHGGGELFYIDPNTRTVTAARLAGSASGLVVLGRRPLFRLGQEFVIPDNYAYFDVGPDDRRFLLIRRLATSGRESPPLVLIQNWFEELRPPPRE